MACSWLIVRLTQTVVIDQAHTHFRFSYHTRGKAAYELASHSRRKYEQTRRRRYFRASLIEDGSEFARRQTVRTEVWLLITVCMVKHGAVFVAAVLQGLCAHVIDMTISATPCAVHAPWRATPSTSAALVHALNAANSKAHQIPLEHRSGDSIDMWLCRQNTPQSLVLAQHQQ